MPDASLQLPWLGVAETKVVPGGRVWVNVVPVALAPISTAPRVQLTVPLVWVQAPWLAAADTKVVLDGRVTTRKRP